MKLSVFVNRMILTINIYITCCCQVVTCTDLSSKLLHSCLYWAWLNPSYWSMLVYGTEAPQVLGTLLLFQLEASA